MFVIKLGNLRIYLIVLTVNLTSLLSGMMLTWPSPTLPKLSSNSTVDNPLGGAITSKEQSWIASLASLGGVFGPSLIGLVMNKWGRKPAIVCVHLPNIASTLLAALGNSIWYFYVSRFLAGMSIYSGISVGALYFGEVADIPRRGLLFSTTSVFINVGLLLSYCIGPYTSIRTFNLIIFGIAMLGVISTWCFVVESPLFLVKMQRIGEAKRALILLRNRDVCGDIEIQKELNGIQRFIENKVPSEGLRTMLNSKVARKSLLMSLIVTSMQQSSGIIIIYSYTQLIFEKSGSSLSSEISSILVGAAQLLTICISSFGVDNLGRKRMLCISTTGLAFTLAILGTFFSFQSFDSASSSDIDWLPLVCFISFFVFFNAGLSTVPFLYMSEILPANIRTISTSIVMAIYCLIGFTVTYFYNGIVKCIGASGAFFTFSGCMVVFGIYVFIVLFETRGMSLQEIQKRLGRSSRSKNAFETAVEGDTA